MERLVKVGSFQLVGLQEEIGFQKFALGAFDLICEAASDENAGPFSDGEFEFGYLNLVGTMHGTSADALMTIYAEEGVRPCGPWALVAIAGTEEGVRLAQERSLIALRVSITTEDGTAVFASSYEEGELNLQTYTDQEPFPEGSFYFLWVRRIGD